MPEISVNGYGQIFDLESGAELCTSCSEQLELDECGQPHGRSRSGKGICESCADRSWSLCYSCGVWVLDNYFNSEHDSCQQCINENYFTCESCDNLFPNDDYCGDGMCEYCYDQRNDDDDDDNYREGIYGYHSGPPFVQTFHTASGKLKWGTQRQNGDLTYYGIEFECEDVGHDYMESLSMLEQGKFAHAEQDSSLTNGFEVITQPATALSWLHGDMGRAMRRFHTHMIDNGATFESPSIGAHVHVSRTAFDDNHLARFAIFGTHNPDYMRALSGRTWATNYAHLNKYNPQTLSRAVKWQNDDRSRWCNLTNTETIEVRLFAGVNNYDDYLAYIDWIRALIEYTRDLTANDCLVGALLSQSFTQWLADSRYAMAHKLVMDRVPVSQLM